MSADNLNEAWKVPPELECALPRPVRLSGTGITRCVIGVACILVGVGLAARVVGDELRREAANNTLARRLADEGRETQATVARLWSSMGFNGVGYDYSVDGRSYNRGANIAKEHWQTLQIGSFLPIHYLPSDPTQSYPDADPPNSQKHWLLVLPIACFSLGIFSLFAYTQVAVVLRARRLLAAGRPARGVVTRCRASQGRSGGYVVNYDFSLPDGSQCQGRKHSDSPLAEGSVITVLYNPDNPRRSAGYPMMTVRLAAS